jgi:TonB family protein
MKKITLALLFLLAASRPSLAATDPVAQQLLIAAEQQADIFQTDTSPFQMEVDFVVQFHVPTQGHLTYRWESKERWWRKISMGDFQQIEIKDGEKLYTSRNLSFTPVRVGELLSLLESTGSSDRLQVRKQKQHIERGLAITCLQVRSEKDPSEREVCVNPASHEILSDEWKSETYGRRRKEYSVYLEFRGHRYPSKIEQSENGIKDITAQVVSLASAPLDAALLVPPKDAIERRQCADMKHPVPVKTPDPMYPTSDREDRITGDTVVSMTVLANGSIGGVQLVGTSTHSMDDATLQTLKSWEFKPAMCGTESVVSDIQVIVSFRLR